MKKRIVLSVLLALSVGLLLAQETFTARLQRMQVGKGVVVLHQDAEIEALVNGTSAVAAASRKVERTSSVTPASTRTNSPDTLLLTQPVKPVGAVRRVRMNGFRIQVYAGGNSRDAQNKAHQMEGRVRMLYPDLGVYTRFVTPRWICHVGDFRTREEALELLLQIRQLGGFAEAIVVKSKVNALVTD